MISVSRREFARALGLGLIFAPHLLFGQSGQPTGAGVTVDYPTPPAGLDEVVLFPFDDYAIPFRYQLQTGLVPSKSQVDSHKTVLEKGAPGSADGYNLQFYGTIIRVGDQLRMWYVGYPVFGDSRVCYAVSTDGLKWEKPALGLIELNGNKQNNLVGFTRNDVSALLVLHEPNDPDPERRFKLIYEVSPMWIGAAFSPDGLNWHDSPDNPVLKHNHIEPGGLTKFNGNYYMTGQGGSLGVKRALVTYRSADFKNWTDAAVLGLRRDIPPHHEAPGMHAGEQVHLGAALWNRGNVLLGVYGQWHGESNDRRFLTIDLGLVISNDALHYREPIPDFQLVSAFEITGPDDPVASSPAPALEQGQAFENMGDHTYFWYSPWWGGKICVATWTRDRLGYLETVKGNRPNRFAHGDPNSPPPKKESTKPETPSPTDPPGPHIISCRLEVASSDARIFVNAAGLSSQSQLVVDLLDKDFNPLPGYSGKDCIPVTESGVRQPVSWKNNPTLGGIKAPFRIKVRWAGGQRDDAFLYALYVAEK